MNAFEARYSPVRLWLLVAASLAFVTAGAWMLGAFGDDHPQGWKPLIFGVAGIAFFGPCAVVLARRAFNRRVMLRIDRNGVLSTQWSDDLVPWSEVVAVHPFATFGQHMLGIELRDPTRFPARGAVGRLAGANRALTGVDAIWLTVTGTDRKHAELVAAVERFRSR